MTTAEKLRKQGRREGLEEEQRKNKRRNDRKTHSYKNNAASFFRLILPEDVGKRLNFKNLREDKIGYTDEELRAYFVDEVYECGSKRNPIKLALLFEYTTSEPEFPHRLILQYILKIWDFYDVQNLPIPVVLPILIYYGKQRWAARPLHSYLDGDVDLFARFIPGFEYIQVDFSKIPEEEIKTFFADKLTVNVWLFFQKLLNKQ